MSPDAKHALWTRLRCSRGRYCVEHPGPVTPDDLDRACGLCTAMLGAVTTTEAAMTIESAPESCHALRPRDR